MTAALHIKARHTALYKAHGILWRPGGTLHMTWPLGPLWRGGTSPNTIYWLPGVFSQTHVPGGLWAKILKKMIRVEKLAARGGVGGWGAPGGILPSPPICVGYPWTALIDMKPNLVNTLRLDFEFETFDSARYVWQVGGVITTPTENLEFEYDVSLVRGKGISQEEGLLRLLGILKRYNVNTIICHNAAAERSVLAAWCERLGYETPKLYWLDTLALARKTLRRGSGYDLPTLLKRLGIDQGGESHTALPDARGCGLLLEQLMLIRAGKIPMPI